MFDRPAPVEDRLWIDSAARTRGIRAEVEAALHQRQAVLLLVRSLSDREDFARDLSGHSLQVGGDRFAATDLQRHLRTPAALGLAHVDDLRPIAAIPGNCTVVELHVLGRSVRRSDDAALIQRLIAWSPARIVFHHSLDDTLFRTHAGRLQPLLQKLGLRADEPVVSPLLTRAIQRAQQP